MGKSGAVLKVGPLAERRTRVVSAARVEVGKDGRGQMRIVDAHDEVRREVVALTEEGRALLEKELAPYEYQPIRLLKTKHRSIYYAAIRAGYTEDEINAACLAGATTAARKFRPEDGNTFWTLAVYDLRAAVQDMMYETERRAHANVVVMFISDAKNDFGPGRGDGWQPAASDDSTDVGRNDAADDVLALLRRAELTAQERSVIKFRFGITSGVPETLKTISIRKNLSRERIRQIEAKAMQKLRKAAGVEELTHTEAHP